MKTLPEIRAEIDDIDAALVPLLMRRLEAVREVAEAKRRAGIAVHDPSREREILQRVAERTGEASAEEVQAVFAKMFEVAKNRQRALLANTAKAGELTLAVVGLGLIGGSFLKAARRAGYETVALHHGETEGLDAADVVVVALPPEATVSWLRAHAARIKPTAVVFDVCGVKRPVVRAMRELPPHGWTFVGGHPMAGRELSGFANSTAELFLGRSMILTPDGEIAPSTLDFLRRLFASLGFAETVVTTAERHDEMIAFTSQLGHVIAAAYVQDGRVADARGFTAGSYANMTRIATADPETWAALYLADRDALLDVLDGFLARLGSFRKALAAADATALKNFIAAGARAKRADLEREGGVTAG